MGSHHLTLTSQQGSSPARGTAHAQGTCGLSHLQLSPKLVEASQKSPGDKPAQRRAGSCTLPFSVGSSHGCPCFGFAHLSSAHSSSVGFLVGRLETPGVPRAACRRSRFGGYVGSQSTSPEWRRFRHVLDTTQGYINPRFPFWCPPSA